MDVVQKELTALLLPLVVAGVLGGLKWGYPKFKDKVPNYLWPFVVFGLARGGAALCESIDVPCTGNPFAWDEQTVAAVAAAFLAIAMREVGKAGQKGWQKVLAGLREKLTPAP